MFVVGIGLPVLFSMMQVSANPSDQANWKCNVGTLLYNTGANTWLCKQEQNLKAPYTNYSFKDNGVRFHLGKGNTEIGEGTGPYDLLSFDKKYDAFLKGNDGTSRAAQLVSQIYNG
ncbi:MAG: hypothetical protein Q4B28_01110 [bacterium]|nr:hypothetical protein [bacterium]